MDRVNGFLYLKTGISSGFVFDDKNKKFGQFNFHLFVFDKIVDLKIGCFP